MKNILPFLIASFWSILAIGQCPTFTSSDLNSLDCFSGNTSCDLCVGDQFELTVAGDGLPDGGCVEWYYDDASSFNPYNGQGTYIGCGAITSEDPCNVCMSVEAILSHAHGGENNEFVIFNSGGGFNTDDFEFDFDPNNNGSPAIPSDEDIGASTACPLQFPNVSLMGCPSAIPVSTGTDIPQNALVVLFVNNNVSFNYDFSALCATGAPIYIIQSSCDRLLGGFTNSPSTPRTQGIVNADCGCDDYVTYTGSFSNNDGDYILGDGTLGNNGTSAPPVSWTPVNPLISSVDPVSFTVDASMCNGGPYFVKGIVDPLPGNCTQEFTQTLEFDVRCPVAVITGDDEICIGQDADLDGSGGDDYDWSTGESTASITVSPTSTMTYDLTVSIGNCEDDTDFTVDVLPLDNPTLSTHIICEDEIPYDLSNLVDPLYPTGDWSGTGVSSNEFDPDGLGGQTITLTFDSDEDCVADATTTIEVTELELPILSTATLCESDPDLDLTTLADPNYPFGDWIGTGVTGEFFDPSGLGGQTISLEFVPDDDCVDIEFTDIVVTNGATPTLGTETLCESAAIYDLSALADPLYPTGTWSGTGVTTNQFNPTGLGGQTITLTFDSDADCVNDQTTTIAVTNGATPTLGTETLCESAPLYDLSALADPLYPTGTWSGTGVMTNQFNPIGLGGQTITLTFDSDADCVNDQTTTIVVTNGATPTLGTETLCESAPLYDLSALADPLYPTGIWSGTGVMTNQFNPTGLGGQTITLTFDSDANCVNDQTTTIAVTSGATPTLGTETLCESSPLYDLSALADPLYPTGTWSGTGVTTNQFNPTGLGGQTITLTFDSDADCVNDQTTTIVVTNGATPTLGTETLCESAPLYDLSLLADPLYPTGTWSGTGVTTNQFNPTGLGGQTITLTFDSDADCVNDQTTTIVVTNGATPTLGTETLCESAPLYDLSLLADPLYPTGTWSGTGVMTNQFNPTGLGGQTITLTFDSDADCVNDQTTTIVVTNGATPTLRTEILCESSLLYDLSALADPLYPTGTWRGTGVMTNQFNPTGLGGQTITLTFDSNADCVNDQTTTILVESQITFSNLSVNCNNSNSMYVVSFVLNGGISSNYSIGLGSGTITGNVFTSDSISAGSPYQFIISDGSNCPSLDIQDTPNCGCSTNAGNLSASGATPVLFCENEMAMLSPVTNSFLDPNDVLNYVLYEGANLATANVIAANSVPEFSFMAGLMNLNTTYLIAAVAGDDDGSGNVNPFDPCFSFSNSIPIQFTAVPTASFQMDSFFVCDGGTAMVEINFTGTPPFQYQLSENGTAGNVETTMMSTVSLPFTSNVTIEILQIEDAVCVGNVTNSTAEVVVYPPLQITVLDTIFNANDTYSIVLEIEGEDVSNYNFTQSTGILSGQIFTTDPVACDTQVEVCVEGDYCPQVCYRSVIPCQSTNCTSNSGTMDNVIQNVCFGDTLNFSSTGEVLDADDLHCYVLHDNAGDMLGTMFAIYETEELFYASNLSFGTTYYLSSVVGNNNGNDLVDFNDPCLSVSIGTPIVFRDLPSASLPNDFAVCKDEFIDIPVMLTGNAPFTIVYEKENQIVPVGIITSQTNPNIQENFLQPAQIIITDVIDNFCSNENLDTINIDLFPDFSIEDFKIECESATQEFRVSFNIAGGLPNTFQVEGDMGTLTGNTFESQLFASNSNFNFLIFDGNNCDTIVRSGTFDCSCTTNAGTLEPFTDPILICGDEQVSITHNGDEVLDSDDIFLFVMHDEPGLTLGNVFDLNTTGIFEYNNAIVYGQTYYLSAIAGREVSSTVDFQDPCLSISIGNPVVFQPEPSVNFSIQNEICEGDSVLIDLNFTGTPPFLTYYSIIENGMTSNRSFGSTDLNFQQLVQSPTGATQFEIRIDSIVSQGCSATPSGSQIVSILPPSRNLIEQSLCTGDSIIVDGTVYNEANPNDLVMLENGAMNGCDSIIEINLSFSSAIMVDVRDSICLNDTIQINGKDYHQFNSTGTERIQTPGQCDSIINVDLQFYPQIELSLSGGETICKNDTAYLEVSLIGTSRITFTVDMGQGVTAQFNDVVDGELLAVSPGVTTSYEILAAMPTASNCDVITSNTSVLIEVSDLNINAELSDYQGFNVSCFGGNDGEIVVNSTGGAMPVSIVWEDGSTDFERTDLAVGEYRFEISDNAGCNDSMTFQLTAPDEILPELFAENGDCADGQEATLEVTSIDGGVSPFEIFINNQSQGIVSGLPAIFSNINDGTNQIRITDANDCLFEDSFEITTGGSMPMVNLGQDTTIFLGDEIQLNASTNIIPDSVVWTTTTGLNCDTCLNPIARPQSDSRIQVTIYDENGCSDMDDILIKVLKTSSVYIPDAFSPNNDGINDFFTIFADARAEKINIFSIYDRWGNNVFQGTDLPINETTSGWDGKYRGKTLNSGVYIFFAEIEFMDGSVELFEGDVTLY